MRRRIRPVPLTARAFSRYGDVIETAGAQILNINEGNTTRFHNLAALDLTASGGRPTISIFRSTPMMQPLQLKLMERHPLSSQAFYPLSGNPYLVVVAPPGELDPRAIEAFLATPTQGVNYHAGTWHHYSLALGQTSDFLVIDRDADDSNCDEVLLPEPDWLEVELPCLQ